MNFGYQIQPAFILVQGESDFSLLTVIANFFGFGTVNVNHADDTSVRYQYRIVNLDFLIEVIIPFFRLVFLHTKKSKEFEIWAECTEYLYDYRDQFAAKPDLAITLMEKIKTMRYQGAQTKLTEKFIATCDKVILKIEAYKQNKRKGMV